MNEKTAEPRLLEVDDENDMSGFPRFLEFYRRCREAERKGLSSGDGDEQHDIYIIPLKNLKLSADLLGEREAEGNSPSAP